MNGSQTEVLNERKVEEIYGFTIPYLRRARRERRGPRFLKLGKLVRYRKADIESFLSANAVETRASGAHQAPLQETSTKSTGGVSHGCREL